MNETVCKIVADRIIKSLDQGIIPWRKPWCKVCDCAFSYATGAPYSLINQFLLEERKGEYLTYKQAKQAGGYVKKGAKSQQVVFWSMLRYDRDGNLLKQDDDCVDYKTIPYLRYYNVFHIDDCEGVKPKINENLPCGAKQNVDAETVIADYIRRTGLKVNRDEKSNKASYSTITDTVTIPLMEQFESTAEYYATIFHELVHSTGHPSRLNRLGIGTDTSEEKYSREELIAEIGSATIMATLGLESSEQFANSASYIQSWRDRIAEDNSLIVVATGRAEKALELIFGDTLTNKLCENNQAA